MSKERPILTFPKREGYHEPAAPHWVAGISLSNYRAHRRSSVASFFMPAIFNGGCGGGAPARGSLYRKANPVASATQLISLNVAALNFTEIHAMNTKFTPLIPVFSGDISGSTIQLVDARLLHSFLGVARDFSTWIKNRIEEYGFIENLDFLVHQKCGTKTSGRGGNRKAVIDYHLTIDMAKELGMIERNEKGRQIRRYFLEMERQAKQAPAEGIIQVKLSDNQGLKAITLQLEQSSPAQEANYFVTVHKGSIRIQAVPSDCYVLNEKEFVQHLQQECGYFVVKKSELMEKLKLMISATDKHKIENHH